MREDVETLKRASEIFTAHYGGETYKSIGARLGVSSTAIAQADRGFKRYAARAAKWLSPQKDVMDDITASSVDRLPDLSLRVRNCFKVHEIETVNDLLEWTDLELMRLPNMGRKSVEEIKEVLGRFGLHIGFELPKWFEEREARKRVDRADARATIIAWSGSGGFAAVHSGGASTEAITDDLLGWLAGHGFEVRRR